MWNNNITELVAELKVPWDDLKVLSTPSKELNIVNYYFSSICCQNKELEKLLYECVGSCLCKTAKLQKAFIFYGAGRNGKGVLTKIVSK